MANIQGIDDFNRAIAELSKDLQKRVIRSALRAAAKPIVTAIKAGSKVLQKPHPFRIQGVMRDSVRVTASRINNGRKGAIGVFIKPQAAKGVTRGAKSPLDPFYYRFVANGFHAVGSKRVAGGKLTRTAHLKAKVRAGQIKFIKGNDYIGKAFNATSGQALQIFQTKLKARIDAANRRK